MSTVTTHPRHRTAVLTGGIMNQGKSASLRLVACATGDTGLWAFSGCLVCGCSPDQCGPGGGCAHQACCIDHYPLPAFADPGNPGDAS